MSDIEENEEAPIYYTDEATLASGPYYNIVSSQKLDGNQVTNTHATFSHAWGARENLVRYRRGLFGAFIAPTSVQDREAFPRRNHAGPMQSASGALLGWGFRFRDPNNKGTIRRLYITNTRSRDEDAPCQPLGGETPALDDQERCWIEYGDFKIEYDAETAEAPWGGRFDVRIDDYLFPRDEDEDPVLRLDPRRNGERRVVAVDEAGVFGPSIVPSQTADGANGGQNGGNTHVPQSWAEDGGW